MDVALLFSTDPAIADDGLVELTDDLHLQPAENVTPLLRTEVVERVGSARRGRHQRGVRPPDHRGLARPQRPAGHAGAGGGGRGLAQGSRACSEHRGPDDRPTPSEPADLDLDAGQLAVAPTARRSRRRRRPSGAAPPLPRSLGTTGKGWLVAVVLLVAWVIITLISPWARRVTNQVDAAVIRVIVSLRVEWLSKILRAINRVEHRVDHHGGRTVAPRRPRRVPAVAPPLHVPGQRRHRGGPGQDAARRLRPAPALRRDDHRPVEGLLVAVAAGGRGDGPPDRDHLHDGGPGPAAGHRQGRGRPSRWRSCASPGSTSASTTPSTIWWRSRCSSRSR